VYCQRFFIRRAASGWFRVGSGGETASPDNTSQTEAAIERVQELFKEEAAKEAHETRMIIQVGDDRLESNGWLEFVGWATHLQGLSVTKLYSTRQDIREEETALQSAWKVMEYVLDQAQATATAAKVGKAALFEVARTALEVKPNRPFDNRLEEDTWKRYKDVFRQLLYIVYRVDDMADDEKPPFIFTTAQGDLWDRFIEAMSDERGQQSDKPSQEDHDLCLTMIISWFDHILKGDAYRNVLVSSLAVIGIREDGGWESVLNYTPIYSAVIKVARMLVLYQSYCEREVQVLQHSQTMDADDAYDEAESVFRILRGKMARFMVRVHGGPDAEPTPLDWIFEARAYGMNIRYNTPGSGSIEWVDDRVSYQTIRFRVPQLAEMLHTLVHEAEKLLGVLTLNATGTVDGLPEIRWEQFEDDQRHDITGYSFIQDQRNTWLQAGDGWVFKQLVQSASLQKTWISTSAGDTEHPLQESAIHKYTDTLLQFRERVFLLMHMLSMPARATEIGGVRMWNTANGGLRNIFCHRGMLFFVTTYHKNLRISGRSKVIYRYLPRAVGSLLVWYMWLVLPFWRKVQGIIGQRGDGPSAFLWADEVIKRAAGDADGSTLTAAPEPESVWSADYMRRILQRHSERCIGAKLTISSWRHIAIATANRYLNEAFRVEGDAAGMEDGEDGDDIDGSASDHMLDIQAGHGSHIAGMVYARELQQPTFGTAQQQMKFQRISQRWHRFLGFDMQEGGWAAAGGIKRRLDTAELAREGGRYQRFHRLQQVSVHGQLQAMLGPDAAFRGQQEKVIRTIIAGMSPVVYITGTGGGKSLTFMLPAYCSPEGVTVVIVPLVALRTDMYERCQEAGISTHIWQSQGPSRIASLVFVTPESAITKGFQDFIRRLQARQLLDRVVMDECHVVLDGVGRFRPALAALGGILQSWGVQLVFLTATLPPGEEKIFFHRVQIARHQAHVYRGPTRRKNIAYSVVGLERQQSGRSSGKEDGDGEVAGLDQTRRIVAQWKAQAKPGRMIIYAQTIAEVEGIGAALGCEMFHSKIGTQEAKVVQLQRWKKQGKLIVATNALGMGIDVPDVRVVLHIGLPRQLRDYVQESGRAGRDGQASQAVLISPRDMKEGRGLGRAEQKGVDISMLAFTQGSSCRRLLLDEVMDGSGPGPCEAGEAACDVCARARQATGLGRDDGEEGGIISTRVLFRQQQQQGVRGIWLSAERVRKGAGEVEHFRRQLAEWMDRCFLCGEKNHKVSVCGSLESEQGVSLGEWIKSVKKEYFQGKKMERFSGCFRCGLPQEICGRWRFIGGEGEQFQEVEGQECLYPEFITEGYTAGLQFIPGQATTIIGELLEADGREIRLDDNEGV
jgi:superfamily II DNA helicase RecQ